MQSLQDLLTYKQTVDQEPHLRTALVQTFCAMCFGHRVAVFL